MKIVIHGAKGGYHIFTPENVTGLYDARPDFNKVAAIGQQAYSIRLIENYVIYSKYKIIRDVAGDKRTGNIAFSILVPNNKMLSGSDVNKILDQIAAEYASKYIKGNNLENVRENWTFIENIKSNAEIKLFDKHPDDIENLLSGSQDAAFVYYSSIKELQKYFDNPYQNEYIDYKQVFLIESHKKGLEENPLNALSNSGKDFTGKIDLENPRYTLSFNNVGKGGVITEVVVDGVKQASGNKIKRNQNIEVKFSKSCFESKSVIGKWDPVKSNFVFDDRESYIEIHQNPNKIIIQEIDLDPIEKFFEIIVLDRNKNKIDDASITCRKSDSNEEKQINNGKILFKGDELRKQWTVTAKKGSEFEQIRKVFIPESQQEVILLVLKEVKWLKITVLNEEDESVVYDWHLLNKNVENNKIKLIGEETEQYLSLTFKHNDYEDKIISFNAKKDNEIVVKLQKKKKYIIDAGKDGEKIEGCPDYSFSNEGGDLPKGIIKPRKGYKFAGWSLDERKKTDKYSGTLVAQYRKKKSFYKNPKFIAAATVFMLVVGAGVWFLFSNNDREIDREAVTNENFTLSDSIRIIQYVEGNELFPDTLEVYKRKWNNLEKLVTEEKSKKNIINIIKDYLPFRKKTSAYLPPLSPERVKIQEWDRIKAVISERLDSALHIRKLISENKYDELKAITRYSSEQDVFKNAVLGFKKTDYSKISFKDSGNIRSLSLNEIAERINNALNDGEQLGDGENKGNDNSYEAKIPTKDVSESTTITDQEEEIVQDPNNEIIDYLKGSDLKKDKLQEYKNKIEINSSTRKSIDICLKLWELDGSSNKSYSSLLTEVKKDHNLKKSDLRTFLDEMNNKDNPKYLQKLSGNRKIATLKELKAKVNN